MIVPFSVTNGQTTINGTRLISPLLRVTADGTADLVRERLDISAEPRFVATLVGQGDSKKRSGLTVPVLVSGTFEEPKFTPDLMGILDQELPDKKSIEKILSPEDSKKLEKSARDFLNNLSIGNSKK